MFAGMGMFKITDLSIWLQHPRQRSYVGDEQHARTAHRYIARLVLAQTTNKRRYAVICGHKKWSYFRFYLRRCSECFLVHLLRKNRPSIQPKHDRPTRDVYAVNFGQPRYAR